MESIRNVDAEGRGAAPCRGGANWWLEQPPA